jgi:hypothetical protein
MTRGRLTRFGLACAVLVTAVTGSALGYFSSEGGGIAKGAVTSLAASTLTASGAEGGKVTLSWTTVNAPDGGTVKYYLTRNGGEPTAACPGEAEPEAVNSCVEENLPVGNYSYKVYAVWSSWSSVSAEKKVEMKVGPVTKFAITGSTATPSTGAGPGLTIVAQDAAGKKVGTFVGSHELTFSGAQPSAEGKVPTVTSEGVAVPFGSPTALTFSNGEAKYSSTKNGYAQIYKPGEAQITVSEGALTSPTPLTVKVMPTATKLVVTAEDTTPTVNVPDGLTIKAYDAYGNASTNFTGTRNITFTGLAAAPSGTAATVESSAGKAVAIGTATPLLFEEGVFEAAAGTPGGFLTAYKSATTAQTLKAAEGSASGTLPLIIGSGAPVSISTVASPTTSLVTTTTISLTTTAKDTWGNTATSFAGTKVLNYNGTGTATEVTPAGTVSGVVGNASTAVVPFNTETPVTFTNGVAAPASSKNGYMHLYHPGTATVVVESEELGNAPALNFSIGIGAAKKLAWSNLTTTAGTLSTPCFFTCAVTGTTNAGQVSAALQITDEYGNQITNIGAAKTVAVSANGGSITGSPMTIPAEGPAVTTTRVTYKPPATGTFSNTITATSTGYSNATATAK